jgi:hypothetical protein
MRTETIRDILYPVPVEYHTNGISLHLFHNPDEPAACGVAESEWIVQLQATLFNFCGKHPSGPDHSSAARHARPRSKSVMSDTSLTSSL